MSKRLRILKNLRDYNVHWAIEHDIGYTKTSELVKIITNLNNKINEKSTNPSKTRSV